MTSMILDATMIEGEVEAHFAVSRFGTKGKGIAPHCVASVIYDGGIRRETPYLCGFGDKQGAVAILKGILHLDEITPPSSTLNVVTKEGAIFNTLYPPHHYLEGWKKNGGKGKSGKVAEGYNEFLRVEELLKSGRLKPIQPHDINDNRDVEVYEIAHREAKDWAAVVHAHGGWEHGVELWNDELRALKP